MMCQELSTFPMPNCFWFSSSVAKLRLGGVQVAEQTKSRRFFLILFACLFLFCFLTFDLTQKYLNAKEGCLTSRWSSFGSDSSIVSALISWRCPGNGPMGTDQRSTKLGHKPMSLIKARPANPEDWWKEGWWWCSTGSLGCFEVTWIYDLFLKSCSGWQPVFFGCLYGCVAVRKWSRHVVFFVHSILLRFVPVCFHIFFQVIDVHV